jgi:hypothetical protein
MCYPHNVMRPVGVTCLTGNQLFPNHSGDPWHHRAARAGAEIRLHRARREIDDLGPDLVPSELGFSASRFRVFSF